MGSLKFATNAGVKQVFIENQLLKSLALQKVAHKRFEVARIIGQIKPQVDKQLIFDELEMPRDIKAINAKADSKSSDAAEKSEALTEQQIRAKQRFQRKSLFLMSKEYRLAELHNFLNQQHNIQTMLLDNRLNYKDKIYIYLDKDTK
mmetsp:Transcript_2597/g.3234  ORF Transcript_2597/g.3234 Transcript_2597/m.3234 type:complete len:147 (+) Transcript_2597:1716-2156(+)